MTNDTRTDHLGAVARLASPAEQSALQPRLQLGMGRGVQAVRESTLLRHLEQAEFHIRDLIAKFDGLPQCYQPGSDLWERYDALQDACATISDAHNRWIGD